MYKLKNVPISTLKGKTLKNIVVGHYDVKLVTTDNEIYVLNHTQICCEEVEVLSVDGCLDNIIGHPIVVLTKETVVDTSHKNYSCQYSWFFIATYSGNIVVTFYGETGSCDALDVYLFSVSEINDY